jgi:hypothetical protein
MSRQFHPAPQYDPAYISQSNSTITSNNRDDTEYGYYDQAPPILTDHPPYEDDYYNKPGKRTNELRIFSMAYSSSSRLAFFSDFTISTIPEY